MANKGNNSGGDADGGSANGNDVNDEADSVADWSAEREKAAIAQRRGRLTSRLQYLLHVVMKSLRNNKFSWPFRSPVDSRKLNLPDYHEIVTTPMDLGTIRARLQTYYYHDAQECIRDFETMFANCFLYNKPDEDIVLMAKHLQRLFRKKLVDMPASEVELYIPESCASCDSREDAASAEKSPCTAGEATMAKPQRQKSVKRRADTTTRDCAAREISGDRGGKFAKRQKTKSAATGNKRRRSVSKKKINKCSQRDSKRKDKGVFRHHGVCKRILEEILDEKNAHLVKSFYKADNYLPTVGGRVVRNRIDLQTVQKKITNKQYKRSAEFAEDIRQIVSNCYSCNPDSRDLVMMASQLQHEFELRYATMPYEEIEAAKQVSGTTSYCKGEIREPTYRVRFVGAVLALKTKLELVKRNACLIEQEMENLAGGKINERREAGGRVQNARKDVGFKRAENCGMVREQNSSRLILRKKCENTEVQIHAKNRKRTLNSKRRKRGDGDIWNSKETIWRSSDSEEGVEKDAMPYDEMRLLILNIGKLPGDKVASVINIVKSREPFYRKFSSDEMEIDFPTLKPSTLAELKTFVLSCFLRKSAEKKGMRKQENTTEKKRILEERLEKVRVQLRGGGGKRVNKDQHQPSERARESRLSDSSSDSDSSSSTSSTESSE